MEVFVMLIVGILVTILCAIVAHNSDAFPCVIVSACVAVGGTMITQLGHTISLHTDTHYVLMGEYHSDSASVLELHNKDWISKYTYKVNCADIKGGCPNPWPRQFKTVMDGKKFVIIPIESVPEK